MAPLAKVFKLYIIFFPEKKEKKKSNGNFGIHILEYNPLEVYKPYDTVNLASTRLWSKEIAIGPFQLVTRKCNIIFPQ